MHRSVVILAVTLLCAAVSAADVAIEIDQVRNASRGEFVDVVIALDNNAVAQELGGFDLLFDHSPYLAFQEVQIGSLPVSCDWEYFTYSFSGAFGIRIVALADMNNGAVHPSCYAAASGELAVITFLIGTNPDIENTFLSVFWRWADCGDNTLSSRDGDTLFLSDDIYGFDGFLHFPKTYDTTLPTSFGAPDSCLGLDKSASLRGVDFYDGGVWVTVNDIIPPVTSCPGNMLVPNAPGECGSRVF
ncbi:MAG: hypothetical protein KKA42_12625, partial [candidate division Zixibacteria bacterium]|nr:hypothetical protein [candidate division Zixibacteria bacterium]